VIEKMFCKFEAELKASNFKEFQIPETIYLNSERSV
jgi:hypothetical protein